MRLSEGVFRLALVTSGVGLPRVVDSEFRCDSIQFADFSRARFPRLGEVIAAVLQPTDAKTEFDYADSTLKGEPDIKPFYNRPTLK